MLVKTKSAAFALCLFASCFATGCEFTVENNVYIINDSDTSSDDSADSDSSDDTDSDSDSETDSDAITVNMPTITVSCVPGDSSQNECDADNDQDYAYAQFISGVTCATMFSGGGASDIIGTDYGLRLSCSGAGCSDSSSPSNYIDQDGNSITELETGTYAVAALLGFSGNLETFLNTHGGSHTGTGDIILCKDVAIDESTTAISISGSDTCYEITGTGIAVCP